MNIEPTTAAEIIRKRSNIKIIVISLSFAFLFAMCGSCLAAIVFFTGNTDMFVYLIITTIGFTSNILSYILGHHQATKASSRIAAAMNLNATPDVSHYRGTTPERDI